MNEKGSNEREDYSSRARFLSQAFGGLIT